MTSITDICNRSLLSIGARTTIANLNEGSVESDACSVLFQPTFEALARTAQWDCLRKEVTLGILAAAVGTPENPSGNPPVPPFPWLYSYAYPNDCLMFRWIVPSCPITLGSTTPQTSVQNSAPTWLPTSGQIPYAIATVNDNQKVVLTNQDLAIGVYTADLNNPQMWDSLFQQAMVSSLAVYLVPALSLSLPLMQLSIQSAEKAIIQARTADGNEGVTTMDHLPDWMSARAGAQGYIFWGYNGFTFPDMIWPSIGGNFE